MEPHACVTLFWISLRKRVLGEMAGKPGVKGFEKPGGGCFGCLEKEVPKCA